MAHFRKIKGKLFLPFTTKLTSVDSMLWGAVHRANLHGNSRNVFHYPGDETGWETWKKSDSLNGRKKFLDGCKADNTLNILGHSVANFKGEDSFQPVLFVKKEKNQGCQETLTADQLMDRLQECGIFEEGKGLVTPEIENINLIACLGAGAEDLGITPNINFLDTFCEEYKQRYPDSSTLSVIGFQRPVTVHISEDNENEI